MRQLLWLLLFIPMLSQGQSDQSTNGVIVKVDKYAISDLMNKYALNRSDLSLRYIKSALLDDTYLITNGDDKNLLQWCLLQKEVVAAELNYKLSPRIKPNDTRLSDQYYLNLINAYNAWDITNGGTDFAGKEIIIGVVDDGYDLQHEDLSGNIYLNPDEIAGDNKDNDSNGFIDDVNGWNQRTKNGVHDLKSHGTNILGVLGAKGNNQKGIAGINWNIKILPVTTGTYVNDVIESYGYLLKEKELYNKSGGLKGSNILVINYSGGLNNAFATDHPIWCGMYDKLGKEGILSVASTTNEDTNVEVEGDMPSTCTSPYLLIVNSTNKADEKDFSTGYGNVSIDIAAPGEKILTTDLKTKGTYKTESGTSLSTPMVAGAAALLYAIKCANFHAFSLTNKSEAVLAVKDALITGADQKTTLRSKNVSEGRLNIFNSMNKILGKYCDGEVSPKGDLKISSLILNENRLFIDYITPDNNETELKIFDSSGKEIYRTTFYPPFFGEKKLEILINKDLSDIYYFVSLFSGKQVASKGFFQNTVRK